MYNDVFGGRRLFNLFRIKVPRKCSQNNFEEMVLTRGSEPVFQGSFVEREKKPGGTPK